MSKGPSFLSIDEGKERLAYHYSEGRSPAVLFCSGFQSSMDGTKALTLEKHSRQLGYAFCRFDYRGHGASSTAFDDCILSDWIRDASTMVTELLRKNHSQIVLVGSSMGAWIGCHVALQHPSQVVGLVGIAAAPDFLQDLYDTASSARKKEWADHGFISVPTEYDSNPYSISWELVDDARKNWSILSKPASGKISIKCPVRLIHGRQDEDIHWTKSMELLERLETEDVVLSIVKDGDHRLSRPQDLDRICKLLTDLLHGSDRLDSSV